MSADFPQNNQYTLANVTLDWGFGSDGTAVNIEVPADLIQQKLREIGYEISGPKRKRRPVVIRNRPPVLVLQVVPGVKVTLSVVRIQEIIRRAWGEFDVYELPKRAYGWS